MSFSITIIDSGTNWPMLMKVPPLGHFKLDWTISFNI